VRRTGNAASGQLQLDVWGETLDAFFLARQAGLPADQEAWALQTALMNHLESAWRAPDNWLWEVRGDRQHFTQAYGCSALDASLLLIPRVGFLPGTDPRVLGTIAAVRRELSDGGLIRRYQTTETDDGSNAVKGCIPCSFWLVDALNAAGQ
jgi:GH15 family glucan-1,4-alpha-glucosidase